MSGNTLITQVKPELNYRRSINDILDRTNLIQLFRNGLFLEIQGDVVHAP